MRINNVENDLLRLVARGDHTALGALYEILFPFVFSAAFGVLRDHAHAEEVSQDVFLEVWRAAGSYDDTQGTAHGWVTMIARRRAIDRVRSVRAARVRELRFALEGAALIEPDPADHVELGMEAQRVRAAMWELPSEQRELLESVYLHGTPYREIALTLRIPVGTVKSRTHHAIRALRHQFLL